MNHRRAFLPTRAAGWLLGFVLLLTGLQAAAQQDPPGRIGHLNFHQGVVSYSPSGDNDWYEAAPNRPLTTGDRLWTDRSARAELYLGSTALRLDEQTAITLSELDDNITRVTASQGRLQLRTRELAAGQRLEIDTSNLAVVVDAPSDVRIETDPAAGTTSVAVASGRVTLFGESGESVSLGDHQQLTTSGRNLAVVSGAAIRAGTDFDRWVAERDRLEDQSVSARYVSRDVVGYQQLDAYGDWQNDPTYGEVWYPRDVGPDWAPYSDGQWVDVAPWGWTWVDAAPWGFAPAHYGRWARIGPRWCWVPGRRQARPVYSPALVGFVGGAGAATLAIGNGRNGVGWFPLAPGETWRPGYHASQRYVDEANRAAFQRQIAARNAGFANQHAPGAVTVVPTEMFGHGPIGRRDVVRLPADRLAGVPVGMGAPIPPHADHGAGAVGRPAAAAPPAAIQLQQAQQLQQFQQAQRLQQARQQPPQLRGGPPGAEVGRQQEAAREQQLQQQQQQQQQLLQQRAAQAQAAQALQLQQAQQLRQAQQLQPAQRQQQEAAQRAAQAQAQQQVQQQQPQAQRQQQEAAQRAAQAQAQQQVPQQQQQAQRQQQEAAQRAAQAQAQQQVQQQQQQAQRQQQEAAQRAAQAQAQQQMQQQQQQVQRQQQEAAQRAAQAQAQQQVQQQQQQVQRQQQEAAQRAAQAQAQQQMQQQQQQALHQQQEMQQRAAQAQLQQQAQRAQQQLQMQQAQQAQAAQQMNLARQAQQRAQQAAPPGEPRPPRNAGQPPQPDRP